MVSRHNIWRAWCSRGSEASKAPTRKSRAKRASDPGFAVPVSPYSFCASPSISCAGSSPASASRSAIAMLLATSRASKWASCGSSGSRSCNSTSRARASTAGPVGRSRIGGYSGTVQQHEDLQFAFGRTPSGEREIEIAFARYHIAVALLQRDHRPANARQQLPEKDPPRVDRSPRLALVSAVEGTALGDAAGFTVEPRKAPAFGAKPADILVRIPPTGKFPIKNAGQGGAVQHVVAGAKVVMAKHRVGRRRHMRLEPADAPFEHRPRRRMAVEIGAKGGHLLCRTDLFVRSKKCEIGTRRADRVYLG